VLISKTAAAMIHEIGLRPDSAMAGGSACRNTPPRFSLALADGSSVVGPGDGATGVVEAVAVGAPGVVSWGVCVGSMGAVASPVGSPLAAGDDRVGTGVGISARAGLAVHTDAPRTTTTSQTRKPARRAARPPEPAGNTWTDPDK
jgi:hypothetical protein